MEIIKENDLVEFELEEGDFSVRIRRGSDEGSGMGQPVYYQQPQMLPPVVPQAAAQVVSPVTEAPIEEVGVDMITSPMVGTFYRAASPESEPFASAGQKVTIESVVCIIEAMKVMNEIQSEKTGVVLEVLVEDGDTVEFGQPLFKVKTS